MFGIISDESFDAQLNELSKKKTIQPRATVVDINRGRGNTPELPSEIRKLISEESINGVPAKELSKLFHVSESAISAYKHDATSTSSYHNPDNELKEHNDKVRNTITSNARGRLLAALDNITDDKLREVKVRDAAGIAKDMSAIIRNLEPVHTPGGQLNQQFIFYAPKTRSESDFEVIEARE